VASKHQLPARKQHARVTISDVARETRVRRRAIDLPEKSIRAVRSGEDEPRTSITLDFRFVQRASDAPPGGNR
jgi:hypothetical protein